LLYLEAKPGKNSRVFLPIEFGRRCCISGNVISLDRFRRADLFQFMQSKKLENNRNA